MPLTKTTVAGTPKRACLKPRLRATWCWDFSAARAGTPPTRNFHLELHALLLCRFSPLQVLLSRHCRIRKHRPVRDFSKRAESASPSASPAHARHAPGRPDPNSPRLCAAMALLSSGPNLRGLFPEGAQVDVALLLHRLRLCVCSVAAFWYIVQTAENHNSFCTGRQHLTESNRVSGPLLGHRAQRERLVPKASRKDEDTVVSDFGIVMDLR